jgi:hypothetical protein
MTKHMGLPRVAYALHAGLNRRSIALDMRYNRGGLAVLTRVLIASFGLWSLTAYAIPTPLLDALSDVRYNTLGIAVTPAQADVQSDASPPSSLPLVSSAIVVGATDFASGNAIAASGLLQTSAEADSDADFASAVATSELIGTLSGFGGSLLHLVLDFSSFDTLPGGTGVSSGNLFVSLTQNNVTVFSQLYDLADTIIINFTLLSGAPTTLDVLLTSQADVLAGGSAFNLAQVGISGTVPTPGSLLLVLCGLLALMVHIGNRRQLDGARASGFTKLLRLRCIEGARGLPEPSAAHPLLRLPLPLRVPRVLAHAYFLVAHEYLERQNVVLVLRNGRRRSRNLELSLHIACTAVAFRGFPVFEQTALRCPQVANDVILALHAPAERQALGEIGRCRGRPLPALVDGHAIGAKELGASLVERIPDLRR